MTASRGFKVMLSSVRGSSVRCEGECNLDSDSFGRQA